MKVIRLNENVIYLGYCESDRMYHFSTRDGQREAYSKVKVVDCGVNDVYYCDSNGKISLRFKPVTESQLKSIVNNSKKAEIVRWYQNKLSELTNAKFAQ